MQLDTITGWNSSFSDGFREEQFSPGHSWCSEDNNFGKCFCENPTVLCTRRLALLGEKLAISGISVRYSYLESEWLFFGNYEFVYLQGTRRKRC